MQDAQRSVDLCFEQWDKGKADNTQPFWAQFNSYFTFALNYFQIHCFLHEELPTER